MQNQAQVIKATLSRFKAEMRKAPGDVAIIGQNFFLRGFKKGGKQINGGIQKWKARKFETDRSSKSRQVLTKTGKLSDSIKQKHSGLIVDIYTNSPYAPLHQNGGNIKITPKMRKFFWAMYFKEMGSLQRTAKGKVRGSATNQRITETAQIWRNLALKKGSLHFPQREIFYDSIDLAKQIDKFFKNRLNNI